MKAEVESKKEDAVIIEEVKEVEDVSGQPRKGYEPKRQEFVMMYVIHKGGHK